MWGRKQQRKFGIPFDSDPTRPALRLRVRRVGIFEWSLAI
jgi:hypothetical protein